MELITGLSLAELIELKKAIDLGFQKKTLGNGTIEFDYTSYVDKYVKIISHIAKNHVEIFKEHDFSQNFTFGKVADFLINKQKTDLTK